jgi:hypothetical protein
LTGTALGDKEFQDQVRVIESEQTVGVSHNGKTQVLHQVRNVDNLFEFRWARDEKINVPRSQRREIHTRRAEIILVENHAPTADQDEMVQEAGAVKPTQDVEAKIKLALFHGGLP